MGTKQTKASSTMLKDLSTLPMRCSSCKKTQQIKLRDFEPRLTRCLSCNVYLNIIPSITEKPNNILISLAVIPVVYDAVAPGVAVVPDYLKSLVA